MANPVADEQGDQNVSRPRASPAHSYWAWSEKRRQWIAMTFPQHQAWLARPDLDPIEFVHGDEAS